MNIEIETRVLTGGRPRLDPNDRRVRYSASVRGSVAKVLTAWLADLQLDSPAANPGRLLEAMVAQLQGLGWNARTNKTAAPVSTPQAAALSYPVGQQKLPAANRQPKRK